MGAGGVLAAPILVVDSNHPQPRHIARAVATLEAGGVIAYPTDSYYGIGCDLFNRAALERIYELKSLPKNRPLSFICSDLSEVSRYAVISTAAFKVMRRLVPGPYTFVLPATREVPRVAVAKQRTVGIRVPENAIARSLAKELGRPLVSTSASTAQGSVLIDPVDIKDLWGNKLDLIIDGGYQLDEPTTVLDLCDDEVRVLRLGKGDVTGVA